jgi:predicted nucleic acid-binding protein
MPCIQCLPATARLTRSSCSEITIVARFDIGIAALAKQIGATVITQNKRDFILIKTVIGFEIEGVSIG